MLAQAFPQTSTAHQDSFRAS